MRQAEKDAGFLYQYGEGERKVVCGFEWFFFFDCPGGGGIRKNSRQRHVAWDTLDVQATFLRFYAGLRDFMESGIQSGFSLGAFSIGRQNRALEVQGAAARRKRRRHGAPLGGYGEITGMGRRCLDPRAEAGGSKPLFVTGPQGLPSPKDSVLPHPVAGEPLSQHVLRGRLGLQKPQGLFHLRFGAKSPDGLPQVSPHPAAVGVKGKKNLAGKVVVGKPGGQGRGDGPAPVGRPYEDRPVGLGPRPHHQQPGADAGRDLPAGPAPAAAGRTQDRAAWGRSGTDPRRSGSGGAGQPPWCGPVIGITDNQRLHTWAFPKLMQGAITSPVRRYW